MGRIKNAETKVVDLIGGMHTSDTQTSTEIYRKGWKELIMVIGDPRKEKSKKEGREKLMMGLVNNDLRLLLFILQRRRDEIKKFTGK